MVLVRQLKSCSWCDWNVQIDAKGEALLISSSFHFPAAPVKRCGHLVCSSAP